MAWDRKPADELSVAELEQLLARKKMQARQARLQRFRRSGRALPLQPPSIPDFDIDQLPPGVDPEFERRARGAERRRVARLVFSRLTMVVEIAAVAGLVLILLRSFEQLRFLNQEVAQSIDLATPEPTPLITAVVLPSGHTPPTSEGGARPNEAEIPENLRPLVQSLAAVPIPTAGPEHARSIYIAALWSAPAPVVQGDGWEQLKKGVGHHIGSANPGQKGNLILSAHNDIFGELFRYLDKLQPGDEIVIETASRTFVYRVTGLRIVDPTDVSVMAATGKPTITLISCYPYMVDNRRIVVFGELVNE